MAVDILKQKLDELIEERNRVYSEQLQPLDKAIEQLSAIVSPQNGKSETPKAPAPKAEKATSKPPAAKTRSAAKAKTEPSSKAPTQSKPPAKSAKPPAKSSAPGQATAEKPAETKAPAPTAAKQPVFKLKGDFKGKGVDEAIVQILDAEPAKNWKAEDVVAAIANPANKAERDTAIRSVRLFLSRGVKEGKWKKIGENPSTYASKKAS